MDSSKYAGSVLLPCYSCSHIVGIHRCTHTGARESTHVVEDMDQIQSRYERVFITGVLRISYSIVKAYSVETCACSIEKTHRFGCSNIGLSLQLLERKHCISASRNLVPFDTDFC